MKKLIFLLSLILFSFGTKAQDFIVYNVLLKNNNLPMMVHSRYNSESYINLDDTILSRLAEKFLKTIFSTPIDKIGLFAQYRNSFVLDALFQNQEHKETVSIKNDSIFVENYFYINKNGEFNCYGEYNNHRCQLLKEDFSGFEFNEKWIFDIQCGVFNKEINKIFPIYCSPDFYESEFVSFGRIKLFKETSKKRPEALLFKDLVYDVFFFPEYGKLAEPVYDIYSLPAEKRNQLVISILNCLKNKKIKAYEISPEKDSTIKKGNFTKQLKYKEVINRLSYTVLNNQIGIDYNRLRKEGLYNLSSNFMITKEGTLMDEFGNFIFDSLYNKITFVDGIKIVDPDTIWENIHKPIPNPEFEYYYKDTIYHNKFENIIGFRFYEDWYFDEEEFIIYKVVKGLAFVLEGTNENNSDELNQYCKIYFDFNN